MPAPSPPRTARILHHSSPLPFSPVAVVRFLQKELRDILAQRRQEQAREAHPAESDDDDDDDNDDGDEDGDEDGDLLDLAGGDDADGFERAGAAGGGAGGAAASDPGAEDELESVEDASLDVAASPEASASASAASVASNPQEQQQGQAHPAGANVSGTPPGAPSQPLASVTPPPPPSAAAVAAGAGAGAPRPQPQQGLASALSAVAAVAAAAGQRAVEAAAPAPATGRAAAAAAAAAAAGAAPGPVPEPPRLKTLVAVLRRLGVPVLELAFFPAEQRSWLVVSDPNEAARAALGAVHALRNTLAPPYPISEVCEARRAAAAEGAEGAAMAAMAELIASGEDHGRDGRGRKLRLRWGALKPEDMDALLQVRSPLACSITERGCWHRGSRTARHVHDQSLDVRFVLFRTVRRQSPTPVALFFLLLLLLFRGTKPKQPSRLAGSLQTLRF